MVTEIERLTMSVEQAGATLGVSRPTAYKMCSAGTMPGLIRLGVRKWVVSRPALMKFLENAGQPVASK